MPVVLPALFLLEREYPVLGKNVTGIYVIAGKMVHSQTMRIGWCFFRSFQSRAVPGQISNFAPFPCMVVVFSIG